MAVAEEGWFIAYIDLPIRHDGSIVDVIRCWGILCLQLQDAKEEAAHAAVLKMKGEFDLQIRERTMMILFSTKICMIT